MPALLFNNNADPIAEIRESLPQIWASLDFPIFKSYIEDATDNLIEDIGAETYQVAVDHYQSAAYGNESTEQEKAKAELVRLCRLPLTHFAYLEYAPVNDIKDDGNGRRMHVDEDSKMPFDWVLDRQEARIFHRAHKAMDRLLAFLDANASIFIDWPNTDTYKSKKDLLIPDANAFENIIPIDNSPWLYQKTLPFLKEAQASAIALIGNTRFTGINTAIAASNLTASQAEMLNHLRNAIAYATMSKAYRRLAFKLLPEGITQAYKSDRATSKASAVVQAQVREEMAQQYDKEATTARNAITEMVRKENIEAKGETYPQASTKTDQDFINQKHFRV